MRVLLSAVLILVPLLMAPGLSFYFDVTPKIAVLLAGTAAALLVACGTEKQFVIPRPLGLFLAALFISLAISGALSMDPALSFPGSSWRRLGLVTWTAILIFTAILTHWVRGSQQRLVEVLHVTALTSLAVSVYGILQFFGVDPWLPKAGYHIGEAPWTIVRPPGTLGYVTYFANFLVTGLWAGVGLWLAGGTRGRRILGAVSAVACGWAILLSGTRGAMLGVLVGGIAWFLWLPRWIPLRRAVLPAAGFAVALVAFYLSPPGHLLRNRMRWFVEDPAGGARLWLWRDSVLMSLSRPFAGSGPDTFSLAFPTHESAELARLYPDFHYESPHNIFLDALTAQGLPGFLILAAMTAWAVLVAYRARQTDPKLPAVLAASLMASLTAHQVACFSAPTALFFFVTLALIASLARSGPSLSIRGGLAVAIPLAAVLASCAAWLSVADRQLAETRRDLDRGDTAGAIASYESARQWLPPGVNADLWYSRRMAQNALRAADPEVRLRAGQEAYAAARRATALSEDRHNAWYNAAALAASIGDAQATESSLRSAIRSAPRWYKPHWTLARLLAATGRYTEAEREASLAVDLNAGRHKEVSDAADEIRRLVSRNAGPNRP